MIFETKPTAEFIRNHVDRFNMNASNGINIDTFKAAFELVRQFPENKDFKHLAIKAFFINTAFSTAIYDIRGMVSGMSKIEKIDEKLKDGDFGIVQEIAKSYETRVNYSFATKYCHCHRPDFYPIYDGNVVRSLCNFQHYHKFYNNFNKDNLKNYSEFKEVFLAFQHFAEAETIDFTIIDRFLWDLGRRG